MQYEVSFKNVDSNDKVKEFAIEKSSKLERYFNGKILMKWTFSKDHNDQVAHVHVLANSLDFVVESKEENIFTSIEQSLHKVERQLIKHKEIVKSHH